jgi:hypothetical protein
MTPYSLVGGYQRFGGIYRLYLQRRTLKMEISSGTSTLKTEAISSYETLVTTYKTTLRNNPEDHNPNGLSVSTFIALRFQN